jgi:DNA-binding beta-propeller fold protein YncE
VFQYDDPDYVDSPDWEELAAGLFSLDGWRDFGSFVLNRETAEPVPASEFRLHAIPVIAERFTVASGPYRLDDRAGIGTAAGQFNQPRGITLDEAGGVYVVDGGNTRIQHFDPAGAFDSFIGEDTLAQFPGGAGGAGGLALDDEGNLYVADTWNHQIKVFAPSGELLRSWGSFFDTLDDPAQAGAQPGSFYGPRDLVIHDGLLYVTDTGNERVQVFELDGEFVRAFGQIGSGEGQLIEPVGIAVTDDGVVLVADSHNARIARFSLEGEPLEPWPVDLWAGQQFFEPYVIAGPDGRVYASDSVSGQIAVFDADGEGLPPIGDPSLLRPYGMAISSDGLRLLVTDGLANAVITISLQPAG